MNTEMEAVWKNHFQTLRVKSEKEYFNWCKIHGFKASLNKDFRKMDREIKHFKDFQIRFHLYTGKTKSFKNVIKAIRTGSIEIRNIKDPIFYTILDFFEADKKKNRDEAEYFLDMLLFLKENSKMIRKNSSNYIKGLHELFGWKTEWLKSYDTWVAPSHNPDKQFSSLARHLLCKYEVPLFMDSAWIPPKGTFPLFIHQIWFVHVGRGKNIRTADELPFPMTKKISHYFLQTPYNYSIDEAFRWAQIRALGGDPRLANLLRETKIMKFRKDNEFCISVIRFFIDNPMLDTVHIQPIIDYIWEKKYTSHRVFVARGVMEEVGPEQPNFSMSGRTADSLLNQVDRWHRQLGKERKGHNLQWEHTSIKDFRLTQGSIEKKNLRIWTIRELLSSKELSQEGRAMHNCVSSYAYSCSRNRCSIWSMTYEDSAKLDHRLTIEVREKKVNQARGKYNSWATKQEMDIIRRWAVKEDMDISPYIGG